VLEAAGIDEAKQFSAVATIKPADYKALTENSGVRIDTRALGNVRGDTNFAWFTPEQGFVDTAWIVKLVSEGVISRAFAAAAAAADLETPILSAERAQLAQFLPASFEVTPGDAHPDALTRSVIAAIDAAAPAAGSVAAQFRETLKTPDPVAVVRDRVKAYKDRVAGLLVDSGPIAARTGEQQRLYGLLLDRRRALVNDPLFGNARFVVLPRAGSTRPLKPHWTPSSRAKLRFVWTIRASISTCGCALSSVSISCDAVCSRSARSLMMSVLVRRSTWTLPRCDSALRVNSVCSSSARA
jgi:hypothetical protein